MTGASGYIASHIIKQLMENGYRVRGTVRSTKNEKKCRPLRELVKDPKHQLELVEADLLNEQSWLGAVKDCDYVVHVASPVPASVPRDENELIVPAVNGTMGVLRACVQPGSKVKRVVLTASLAAIAGDEFDSNKTYTEADWADPKVSQPYTKSKILAEKAAWEFIENRKKNNEPCFEFSVINPSMVIGPVLHDVLCASMEPIKLLLEHGMPMIPDVLIPMCDVRDVAKMHLIALTSEKALSNRHMIVTESMLMKEAAQVLHDEFGPKGYRVPLTVAPNILIKITALFDRRVKFLKSVLGKRPKFDGSRFKSMLGSEPIPPKKSLIDMANSMIERGFIKKP